MWSLYGIRAIKCEKQLLVDSQTSTVQPLKFGNGQTISSHTLPGVWLLGTHVGSRGLRPVLEMFVVTMHEGACEQEVSQTVRTSPKWPIFCRRYFQLIFLHYICRISIPIPLKFIPISPVKYSLTFVKIMETNHYPKPMIVQADDEYIRLSVSRSQDQLGPFYNMTVRIWAENDINFSVAACYICPAYIWCDVWDVRGQTL